MVSFERFEPGGDGPIYLQILDYIRRGAVAGTVVDGDELPSRRVLSALLGINPNTVQKAFHLLEEEGLIESRSGAKSVMTLDQTKIDRIRTQLLGQDMGKLVTALKTAGVTLEEAVSLLQKSWEGEI